MSHSPLLMSNQFPKPICFLSKHLSYPFLSILTAPGSCPKCRAVTQWSPRGLLIQWPPVHSGQVTCSQSSVGGAFTYFRTYNNSFPSLYLSRLTSACSTSDLLISKTPSLLWTSLFIVPGMCKLRSHPHYREYLPLYPHECDLTHQTMITSHLF